MILGRELNFILNLNGRTIHILIIAVKVRLIERLIITYLVFVNVFPRQQGTTKKQFNLTGTVLRFFLINF